MTTYTTLPQDDSNLDVTVTESNDLVTLNITPASVDVTSAVTSVNEQIGAVVLSTTEIHEGDNLYFTDERGDARVDLQTGANLDLSFSDTDDLVEGPTRLYYTDARADGRVNLQTGVNLDLTNQSTTDLSEGDNLYYTDVRVQTVIDTNTADFATVDYVDTTEQAITDSLTALINTGDADTLTSAKSYTDTEIAAIPPVDLSPYYTSAQVDALPVSTFTNDAGYITSAPASQTLSFQNPNLTISDGNTVDLSALSGGNVTSVNGLDGIVVLDSDDISEGTTNLYHTDARSRSSISLTSDSTNLQYNSSTGEFTYVDPTGSPGQSSAVVQDVRNTTGATIPAGSAVYISGVDGNSDLIELASNDVAGEYPAVGITSGDINNNSNGTITIIGQVAPFDTSAYTENDVLYLSDTAGELTNTRPSSEANAVQNVARVVRVHASQGSIMVLGAGRSNDVPNLDHLHTFIGNAGGVEQRQLTYTDISNTPDLTSLTDVVSIAPDTTNGLTITDAGSLEVEMGYNSKLKLRNGGGGGAVDQFIFDATAYNIFTGLQWRTDNDYAMLRLDAQADNGIDPGDGTHQTNFALIGADSKLKSRTVTEGYAPLEVSASEIKLIADDSIININDLYNLPESDGSNGQVIATDGNGVLTFVDQSGGGGGSSTLAGLDDVGILNLENNDLLMYNSTASEWQNTNLGITVEPTLTGPSAVTAGSAYTVTISNHADYDDVNYFCEVYHGTTKVTSNDDVIDNRDGTLTFATTNDVRTLQVRVKAQDFGDLQSEIATIDFDAEGFGGTFRYWKFSVDGSTDHAMIDEIQFFGSGGQTTPITVGPMTASNAPVPLVAASPYVQGGYEAWEAFAGNTGGFTGWWSLAFPTAARDGAYLTLDHGSDLTVASFKFWVGYPSYFKTTQTINVYGSNTGAFAGEETHLGGVQNTGSREMNLG